MVQGPWRVLTCPTATAVRWWGLRGPGSVRRTGAQCRNCSAADRRCPLPAFAFEGFLLLHVALPGPLLLDRRNPARLPCLLPEIFLRPPCSADSDLFAFRARKLPKHKPFPPCNTTQRLLREVVLQLFFVIVVVVLCYRDAPRGCLRTSQLFGRPFLKTRSATTRPLAA